MALIVCPLSSIDEFQVAEEHKQGQEDFVPIVCATLLELFLHFLEDSGLQLDHVADADEI